MSTRTCKNCNEEYPATNEFFYEDEWKGKMYLRRKCKNCHNNKKNHSKKILALKAQIKAELAKEAAEKNAAAGKMICSFCEKETDYLNEKKHCAACEEEERLYYLEVEKVYARAAAEEEEENAWKIEAAKKNYICRVCNLEKPFDDMRLIPSKKRVDRICKPCNAEKKKEYTATYRARQFGAALAKRRELENE